MKPCRHPCNSTHSSMHSTHNCDGCTSKGVNSAGCISTGDGSICVRSRVPMHVLTATNTRLLACVCVPAAAASCWLQPCHCDRAAKSEAPWILCPTSSQHPPQQTTDDQMLPTALPACATQHHYRQPGHQRSGCSTEHNTRTHTGRRCGSCCAQHAHKQPSPPQRAVRVQRCTKTLPTTSTTCTL